MERDGYCDGSDGMRSKGYKLLIFCYAVLAISLAFGRICFICRSKAP